MDRPKDMTPVYSLMQGLYWMIFCAIIGFASVYLLGAGRSAGDIGILIAASNIAGALLQPAAAELSARARRLTLNQLILLLCLLAAFGSFLLLFSGSVMTLLLYGGLVALLHTIMPLMNAVGMSYSNEKQRCNFGLARAMGSLGFALLSAFMGSLVDRFGTWTIPMAAGVLLLFLILVMALAGEPAGDSDEVLAARRSEGSISAGAIRAKYPGFLLVLTGVFLIYGFHTITNIYLIQIIEVLGGSAREMGITIALAAVLELPAMIFFTPLQKRFGSARILKFAAVFWVVKSLGYLMAGSVGHIYATQLFQAFSFAPFTPAMVYFADELMEQKDRVKGQAFMAAANTLGGVLGSLSGGFFLDLAGVRTMLIFSVSLAGTGALAVFRGVYAGKKRRFSGV